MAEMMEQPTFSSIIHFHYQIENIAEMVEQPTKKEKLINDWISFKLFETELKGRNFLKLYNKQFISRNILEREMGRYKELYPSTFKANGWSDKIYNEFEKCISTSIKISDYERFAKEKNYK